MGAGPAYEPRRSGYAAVRYAVPALACDCHMHVMGPVDRYPGLPGHAYSPRESPLWAWRDMAGAVGLQRLVVVQPSAYGADNACLRDTMRQLGEEARGIAGFGPGTTQEELRELRKDRVRGVRINAHSVGNHDPVDVGRQVMRAAEMLAPLGGHVELYADLATAVGAADVIRAAPVPVVSDHMAGSKVTDDPDLFRTVLDMLGRGQCWVTVSGSYRVSKKEPFFEDSSPIARAMIRANPERILWASDWPHTGGHSAGRQDVSPVITFRDMDVGALLDLLADQCGDEATFRRVLVNNPQRLYGF